MVVFHVSTFILHVHIAGGFLLQGIVLYHHRSDIKISPVIYAQYTLQC